MGLKHGGKHGAGKLTVCDIENGPVEIVDLPINSMVIFHSYVNVYQRVSMDSDCCDSSIFSAYHLGMVEISTRPPIGRVGHIGAG